MIACGSLGFTRQSFSRACAEIARLGFKAIDIAVMESWAHFNPSELATNVEDAVAVARSALATSSLTPIALNASAGASDPNTETPRFRAICEFAAALEVPVICYAAPIEAVGFERALRRYERLAAMAAEAGVVLAVEAHARTMLETPEVAVQFCEAIPGLYLTLDPSHMWAGPHQGGSFDELYPLVRHTHWRDAGMAWEHVQMPVGEGNVDLRGVMRGLKKAGYQGAYAVEYIDTFPNFSYREISVMRRLLEQTIGGSASA
ncbi:sugar phosphate isomerase/epimerase [Candidatus Poribacteria bacterium]|nr:sugar phosphate isomerase/epimerase [Candidatus Poribacteria bacterium]